MPYVFDVQSNVMLPRMKSSTAATVGQSVLSAYQREKKLPENIVHAAKLLEHETELLKRSLTNVLDTSEPVYSTESRAEAGNWSGFESFLSGLAGSSIKKKSAAAAALQQSLFPSGLTFLRMPAADRWTETESRLARIKEHKLDAEVAALGGTDFLVAIHETHKALGDAAGITAPAGVTVKSGVGLAYDRWKAAMRCYVAQVVANEALAVLMAKDAAEVKAANELAARLLAALAAVQPVTNAKEVLAPAPVAATLQGAQHAGAPANNAS